MTRSLESCPEVAELLGAYALDALDDDETSAVNAHLTSCPRCRQEVDQHRETIGLLAAGGGDAPVDVWHRIAASIGESAQPEGTPPTPILLANARRGRSWTKPVAVLTAAAAAIAIALVGVQTARVDHLNSRVNRLNAAAQSSGGFDGPAAAMLDPSAKRIDLTSTSDTAKGLGVLVVLPNGSAFLVDAKLPAVGSTSTYQLWSLVKGRAVSVGLLGSYPTTVAFTVDPDVVSSEYLVTVEPAGGVVAPTSAPVAQAIT